jgi:nucleoid-associated protein YgaU
MYITNLEADITRFAADGTPTKAVGSLELRQFPSYSSGTNPTSGGLAPEMAEVVLQGDTLAHLAYRTYQSPMSWRDIAEHNGVDDPMRIPAGRRMLMPSPDTLPYRAEGGSVVVEQDDSDFVDEEA